MLLQLSRTETAVPHLEITLKISQEVLTHKTEPALTVLAITNDQARTTHQAAHTAAVVAACQAVVAECLVAVAVAEWAAEEDKNAELDKKLTAVF